MSPSFSTTQSRSSRVFSASTDQLQVNGLFNTVGAILDLNVSYAATFGDSFHIFTGNLPTLDALTNESNLGGDLTWDISQLSSAVSSAWSPSPRPGC